MRTERRDYLPVVRQIYPRNPPQGLPSLVYVVQTLENGYFTSRQKELLKTKLQEKMGTEHISVRGNGNEVTVASAPYDSIDGRFVLLDALHEITNPQAPFSALGTLLSSSFNVTNYVLGLQILGTHSDASLARIQQVLNGVTGIESVLREPDYPNVFNISVNDDWRQANTKLLRDLFSYGFGASLHVNQRQ